MDRTDPNKGEVSDAEDDDVALAGLIGPGTLKDLPKRARLDREQSVRRQLVELYRAAKSGRISTLEALRLSRLLAAIMAANDRVGLNRRLERLEAVEEARRRSTRR